MTLVELAKISSKHFVICILLTVLCGISHAQSTVSFQGKSNELSNTSNHLVPAGTTVHGFGVTSLSSYYPDSSFAKAYQLAIEDLRANLLTSIYLENFGVGTYNTNYEYAIKDSIDLQSVVKIDSLSSGEKAYFFVTTDSLHKTLPADHSQFNQNFSALNWTGDLFNPIDYGNYWIAAGNAKMSDFNPYRSWAQSKINALSTLAQLVQTKVQSSFSVQDFSSNKITYITSKVIYQKIIVLDRQVKNNRCYTLIAVHKNNLASF